MVNIGDPWKEPPSLQLQTFWSCLFYFFLFFSQSTSINSVEHESIRDAWVVNSKTGAPTKRMRNSRARPFPFSLSFFLFLKVKKRSQSNARDCTSFLSERTEKRFLYLLHSAARHSYKLDPVLENLFSSSSPKPFRKFRKKRKKKKRGISIARFINFYDKTCGVIGWKDRSWDWTASGTRLKVNKTELERKK